MTTPTAANAWDVVVLGAGAAGMMCAAEAGRRGRRVLLLEHGERVGRKILISGGGRCNFTNVGARAENYLSDNPHFAKSALARYMPRDFIALVEKHGIRYHEKTLGQLFCDDSARQIVTMLERECAEAGVVTRCNVTLGKVEPVASKYEADEHAARWRIETSEGSALAHSVIVATGGLSIPKMGATAFGYELARSVEHTIIEPRAGLVPLVFGVEQREQWCDLAGVAFDVTAQAKLREDASVQRSARAKVPVFRERLLITHRGASGPAVLQASSFWRPGGTVVVDLAPNRQVLTPMLASTARRDANTLLQLVRNVLPARMAERWVAVQTSTQQQGQWTNAGIARLEEQLHAWELRPDGTEGFVKAEVTVGGVDTRELDARTMESRRAPGMHFIGEVVDVTGWLGGYNFQWAWASAVAAGQAV